jgi:fermentation-respiration switch protein FrsA (DUF1100 family)
MNTLLWLIAVYVAICIAAWFGNRVFMYFPDPARFTPAEAGLSGVEEVELASGDGETLIAWFAKAKPGQPTFLYFHGNAGNAAGRAEKIEIMRTGGAGVLYLNNRGYGGSTGKPTEKDNVADAFTAYDYLRSQGVKPDQIVLYGESLGSGQAIRLSASHEVRAVVLEAPLTSTVDVGKRTYFFLPLRYILTDMFHNEKNIRAVKVPVLILHGKLDAVIPVAMGKRVYEAANDPKHLEIMPAAHHSDLFDHGAWALVQKFLAGLR